MSLIIPLRQARQPSRSARLNTDLRGVLAAVIPQYEAVKESSFSVVNGSGYGIQVTPVGLAFVGDNSRIISLPEIPYRAPPFSILLVVKKHPSVTTEALFAFGGASGGHGWKVGSISSTSSLNFTFGGVADYQVSATGFLVDEWAVYVVTCSANTCKGYRNGLQVGSVSVGTPVAPTTPALLLGAYDGAAYTNIASSSIALAVLFDSVLSPSEIATKYSSVTATWQNIYASLPRVVFAPAAVGGSLVAHPFFGGGASANPLWGYIG